MTPRFMHFISDSFSLECPYGFFGQGCADKCNEKCNGCNTENGLCDYGCKSGWTGDNCNKCSKVVF